MESLKSNIYVIEPETLNDLRNQINNECRLITAEMWTNVPIMVLSETYFTSSRYSICKLQQSFDGELSGVWR